MSTTPPARPRHDESLAAHPMTATDSVPPCCRGWLAEQLHRHVTAHRTGSARRALGQAIGDRQRQSDQPPSDDPCAAIGDDVPGRYLG